MRHRPAQHAALLRSLIYLTPHDLLLIHAALLDEFGGMHGVTEAGFARLEAAAATPRQSAFGLDLYPDLPAKAAALAHAIIRNHPFSDGNKRVAVAALDLMLTLNGATLVAGNDQVYALAMAAAERMDREAVEDWVRYHTLMPPLAMTGAAPAAPEPAAALAYITLGDLIDIRDRYAADDPWRFEIVNGNGMLSAITTPFQAAFGHEAFPAILEKAAAMVFLLIANHPFRDGNKRIAGAALRLFLERNGFALDAAADLRALTLLVTRLSEPRDPRLLAWLERHVQAADRP